MNRSQACWAAAYGAFFALQVEREEERGRDSVDPDFLKQAAEEAETVADLAVKHLPPLSDGNPFWRAFLDSLGR